MDSQGFIGAVREAAHIPGDEARWVACATLQTLSERIASGETEDLRVRLPVELRSCLVGAHRPGCFGADDFNDMRSQPPKGYAALWTTG